MARTRRSEYLKSNKIRTLDIPDPRQAADVARRLLSIHDASGRRVAGAALLAHLARQTGIPDPELVVPDEHQPHRRSGGRIVYSLQGDYRRRTPSAADPSVARGGKPLGRIRVPNRTPARGDVVRPSAFLNTLLHEFCHHHDAEALALSRSFHTAGFYARLRDLRRRLGVAAPDPAGAGRARRGTGPPAPAPLLPPLFRLWSRFLKRKDTTA